MNWSWALRAKTMDLIWDWENANSPIFRRDAGMKIKCADLLDLYLRSWINRKVECRAGITFLGWGAKESMFPSSKQFEGMRIAWVCSLLFLPACIAWLESCGVWSWRLHTKIKVSFESVAGVTVTPFQNQANFESTKLVSFAYELIKWKAMKNKNKMQIKKNHV